jgi:hypothetical protein
MIEHTLDSGPLVPGPLWQSVGNCPVTVASVANTGMRCSAGSCRYPSKEQRRWNTVPSVVQNILLKYNFKRCKASFVLGCVYLYVLLCPMPIGWNCYLLRWKTRFCSKKKLFRRLGIFSAALTPRQGFASNYFNSGSSTNPTLTTSKGGGSFLAPG